MLTRTVIVYTTWTKFSQTFLIRMPYLCRFILHVLINHGHGGEKSQQRDGDLRNSELMLCHRLTFWRWRNDQVSWL